MVKLRLIPTGKSVQPSFRVVAIDARAKLNGRYIDILGFYDPIKKVIKINEELTLKFLLTGAQPTETVRSLLSKQGIIEKFHNIKIEQKKLNSTTKKEKATKVAKSASSSKANSAATKASASVKEAKTSEQK